MTQPSAIQLRDNVLTQRANYSRGLASLDDLYAAADAYIAALKAYRKASGKRFTIPSRAYLLRAL